MEPTSAPPPLAVAASPWDDLLVGPGCALAVAAVRALGRGERDGLSPLLLHGPAGVGKTTLLAALAAELTSRRPGVAIAALDAETFAAECATAGRSPERWAALRAAYRQVDLFTLDDLQALVRVPSAIEELGHTIDALQAAGAVVAVASRDAPAQWTHLPPRLVGRLRSGLVVRLDPPDPATLRRHLLARCRARGIALGQDVVDTLVQTAGGFRELDGLLARLALEANVRRRPADDALARRLADDVETFDAPITIAAIARAVASRFGLRLADLRGDSRRAALVGPRHLAMYLARRHTAASFARIGAFFGNRDPATVRHAVAAATARLDADPALAALAGSLARAWPAPGLPLPGDPAETGLA